ncbi:MAG: hypothetical protein JXA50_00045 [Deltaproteobacteria bacterium]|nr:hypothetical protein [Deltaproteobacteria bacterium]
MNKFSKLRVGFACLGRRAMTLFVMLGMIFITPPLVRAQADNQKPPAKTVKLIFIHHSCGENWLADGHGGLGRTLAQNNYFVSDTNYGWGPDGIGDRTDITEWPDWFTGPNSSRYLKALYRESGKHSPYTRSISDPGGENQIIMFKSCFPNSNLEGRPNDPPGRGDGLSVGNAKAIYNKLLTYFATRPDKLFIAITAPPVQDRTYSANARAFNTWLVTKWLVGYKGNNVAVFDFYNVLTGPNNHHRFSKGSIEYVTNRGGNTLYYPTNGDDHPSPAGNRKATSEFVPLLNVYYHRWSQGKYIAAPPPSPEPAPTPQPESAPEPKTTKVTPAPTPAAAPVGDEIANFEKGVSDWVAFVDEAKDTQLTFKQDKSQSHSGKAGLRIEYNIAADSWATCSLVYPSRQDWRTKKGLTLYLHAERSGQKVVIVAYQGNSPDDLAHFELSLKTKQEAVSGWQRVDIPWNKLTQPSWQGDVNVRFDPNRAMGLAFAFDTPDGGRNSGKLWVDDVSFLR